MKNTLTKLAAPLALVAGLATACAADQNDENVDRSEQNVDAEDVAVAPPAAPVRVLTYSALYKSKLFIAGTKKLNCLFGAPPFANKILWTALCLDTGRRFNENPPDGRLRIPLDARILGVGTGKWRCSTAGPAPIGPASFTGGGSVGGLEPGGVVGIANAMGIRDDILLNGTFGMVTSGKPNPLLEPSFQAARFRRNPDIWNKLTGKITCGVDGRGNPTSSVSTRLRSTFFPSDKVFWRSPSFAPQAKERLLHSHGQRSFAKLWSLPPVPAP